jgi:hypothetical protein
MRHVRILRPLTLLGLLLGTLVPVLAGGERTAVRHMGMARSSMATTRGLDAIGINPANISLSDSSLVQFSFLPLGAHVGSDFLDYDLYTTYFTGVPTDSGREPRYLDDNDKRRILDAFTSDITYSSFDVEARLAGVVLDAGQGGAFALTVTDGLYGYADIPKDYIEFALNGNTPGSSFEFGATDAKAAWLREYALSYAKRFSIGDLSTLAIGFSAKIVHGFGYFDVRSFRTSMVTAENGQLTAVVDYRARRAGSFKDPILRSFNVFPVPAGSGVGFDFGIGTTINEYLTFGASVTDVGSLSWSEDAREYVADTTIVVDDPLDNTQREAIEDAIKGNEYPLDAFSTGLPATVRIGAALAIHKIPGMNSMPGELLLELNYSKGLRKQAGASFNHRVALGVEYIPVHWLPLRSGISAGGSDNINIALGFGLRLGVFSFDVASENMTWVFAPNSFSHGSLAAAMKFTL